MAASDWTKDWSNPHLAFRVMFFCTALHSHFILVSNGKETIDSLKEIFEFFIEFSDISIWQR